MGFTLLLRAAAATSERRAHTPATGSSERQAIMDAIRLDFYGGDAGTAHRNMKHISFKVGFLESTGTGLARQ